MIDSNGIQALTAVIRSGSFENAAKQLFLTRSAISQRIKLLEEKVGHTLLIRSSPPRPTPAGASVLKYAQQLDLLERTLLEELQPRKTQDWIRVAIAVNADTLATWFLSRELADWCRRNRVLLQIEVDDQEQTHRLLQNGSVTGCISALQTPPQGCRSVDLGVSRYLCVASPDFKRRWFGKRVDKRGFGKAPALRFNDRDFLQHQFLARYFELDADGLAFHTLPSSEGYLEWLKLGMAWGMTPRSQAQAHLDRGELVELTPNKTIEVRLFWHLWGLDTPVTESLTAALRRAAADHHEAV
ncbi:MAG: LysR family transcriptional regulator ArgP [Gammaproteobacteria bacterium]|nr:LysR family transcriptional regulator ArgP [Gammaproteobacteria bacterium]